MDSVAASPKSDDFHRQRESAQALHALGAVADDAHAIRGHGHDLLAQQRAAAALDEIQLRVDFVRAVDGEVHLRDGAEIRDYDAELLSQGPRLLRRSPRSASSSCSRFTRSASSFTNSAAVEPVPRPENHARFDKLERMLRSLPLVSFANSIRKPSKKHVFHLKELIQPVPGALASEP